MTGEQHPQIHQTRSEFLITKIFIALIIYLCLLSLGLKNIWSHNSNDIFAFFAPSPSPTTFASPTSTPSPFIDEEVVKENTQIITPKLIIKTDDFDSLINVRQSADITSPIIGHVKHGDSFEYQARIQDWYQIILPDNSFGFIHQDFVQVISYPPIYD